MSKATTQRQYLNYLLVFIIILYSSKSISYFFQPISIIVPLILTLGILIFQRRQISINDKSKVPFFVFTILMLLYIFKFTEIDSLFISYHLGLIIITFVGFSLLQAKLFIYYESIVYRLAILSIILFGLQLVFEDILLVVFKAIGSILQIPLMEKYATIGIFTINHNNYEISKNCGFCWEPGPFSVYLTLAMIIRFLSNNLKFDRHIWLYIITLITTLATTGYLGLMVVLNWYIYNKFNKNFLILGLIVTTIFISLFLQVPFLSEKIFKEIENSDHYFELAMENNGTKNISVGRFPGFLLNYQDFKNNPILGYGGQDAEEKISGKLKLKVSSTSGLGNWLAQFGVVGTLLLLISFYLSIKKLVKDYKRKGAFFIYVAFIILAFSFNLLATPVFFSFMLYYFFKKPEIMVTKKEPNSLESTGQNGLIDLSLQK